MDGIAGLHGEARDRALDKVEELMKAETTAELEAALQRQTQQHVSPITTTATPLLCHVVLCSGLILAYASVFVLLSSRVALRFALI